MCGIYGFELFEATRGSFSPEKLAISIEETLQHRGPDAHGHLILNDNLLFGHTRLAFNDLTSKGKQPISDTSGRFTIVMNGEIYNFRELRNELILDKVLLQGNSDTEIVVQGFALYGVDYLKKLSGMFALAIYDKLNEKLILARDYFGEKPLWYSIDTSIAFASEFLVVEKIIDQNTIIKRDLASFLEFGYMHSQRFDNSLVKSVPPGAILEISVRTRKVLKIHKKERLTTKPSLRCKTEDRDIKLSLLDSLIQKKVHQIIDCSEVPIGILLSDGVDSNLVASYLSSIRPMTDAFTLVFPDEKSSQREYRRRVTTQWNFNLHEVEFSSEFDLVKETIRKMPLPLADTSALAQYQLCKFASTYVKACITGDGADELFAGYETYQASLALMQLPTLIRKSLPRLATLFLKVSNVQQRFSQESISPLTINEKAYRLLKYSQENLLLAHFNWRRIFSEAEINYLNANNQDIASSKESNLLLMYPEVNLSIFQEIDVDNWLAEDILPKADSMSMANSLELRTPFLNYEMWEFALSLRESERTTLFQRKKILYDLLLHRIPKYTFKRTKNGFGIPLSRIIKSNVDEIMDVIQSSDLWIDKAVKQWANKILQPHEMRKLYTLFVISFWYLEVYKMKRPGEKEY